MPRAPKPLTHGTYKREPYSSSLVASQLPNLEAQSNTIPATSLLSRLLSSHQSYSTVIDPLAHQSSTPQPITHPLSIHASPTSSRSPNAWTPEDDLLLMKARSQSENWGPIALKYFPSRTPNACRKRHERLMEKQASATKDGVQLDNLAKAYIEVREEMWQILADKVGEKWPIVESKVGLYLLRFSRSHTNRLENINNVDRRSRSTIKQSTNHNIVHGKMS